MNEDLVLAITMLIILAVVVLFIRSEEHTSELQSQR